MTTKKPLFNRPAWASSGKNAASTTTSSSVAEEALFGRQRIYEDIIALERKEKQEKEKAAAAEKEAHTHARPPKKRRVSGDAEEKEKDKAPERISTPGPEDAEHRPSTRSTPRKEKLLTGLEETVGKRQRPRTKSDAVMISLDDDDDPQVVVCTTTESKSTPKKTKNTSPGKIATGEDAELFESDDEDDPYLQELKAKAREKQRLQKLGLIEADKPKASGATAPNRPSPGPGPSSATPALPLEEEKKEVDAPEATNPVQPTAKSLPPPSILCPPHDPAPEDDPEVSIYISPLIPNTKALIVGRKASQPLEPVKTFWCKKQNLSDAETARVFFVWRDMKLYNSSTMRHILARLQKERKPGQKDSEGRIVLEAVTQEIYDLKKAELAAKKETAAAAASSFPSFPGGDGQENRDEGEEEGAALSEAKPPTVACKKFIIKLVSKEYGELPIRIRPESTVGKMALGFVQQMVVPQEGSTTDKVAYLIFDGDRLENEQTAEEVGFEEGDVVEVQFR